MNNRISLDKPSESGMRPSIPKKFFRVFRAEIKPRKTSSEFDGILRNSRGFLRTDKTVCPPSGLGGGSISQNCIQNVRALQCLRHFSEIYHTLQQLQQTRRNFREIYQSRTDDSQVPPSMQHTLDCPILPCNHLTHRTRTDTAGALHR